jgi:hypothetical protein
MLKSLKFVTEFSFSKHDASSKCRFKRGDNCTNNNAANAMDLCDWGCKKKPL